MSTGSMADKGICCEAYGCNMTVGTGCASCVALALRTSSTHCATCNPGYQLSNTSCQAYSCKTSDVGTGCASCVEQSLRTSDAHCASCNANHIVVGASCQEGSPSAHTSTSTEYNRYPHREANTTIGSAMVSTAGASVPCMPLILTGIHWAWQ